MTRSIFALRLLSAALIGSTLLLTPFPGFAAEKVKGPVASAVKGQTLYTQFSLFQEKGAHRTTNYRKGILVPVNTPVEFVKANRRDIVVELPGGDRLTIANVEDFSGETVDGIFTRTFATTPVDLTRFTPAEQKAIRAGTVEEGMTKAAVVVALGYPPKHRTASLDSDGWLYWQNRFNKFLVSFEDDKVSGIKR